MRPQSPKTSAGLLTNADYHRSYHAFAKTSFVYPPLLRRWQPEMQAHEYWPEGNAGKRISYFLQMPLLKILQLDGLPCNEDIDNRQIPLRLPVHLQARSYDQPDLQEGLTLPWHIFNN